MFSVVALAAFPLYVASFAPDQRTFKAVIQSAVTYPALDLSYGPAIVSGPTRIDLVAPQVPKGTIFILGGHRVPSVKKTSKKQFDSGRYLKVIDVNLYVNGESKRATVKGVLRTDNVYFTAYLTSRYGRWIVYNFVSKIT